MSDFAKQFSSFEEAQEFIEDVGMTDSSPEYCPLMDVWNIRMHVPNRLFTSDDFMIEDK